MVSLLHKRPLLQITRCFRVIVSLNAIFLFSCGVFNLGGSGIANDARPTTGQILAQGVFIGQNSQTVSGSAMIFSTSSPTSYILRLESFNAPSGTSGALQVQVLGTGNPSPANGRVYTATLRTNTGNQNYSFNSSVTNITFTNVNILLSTAPPASATYGTALLY